MSYRVNSGDCSAGRSTHPDGPDARGATRTLGDGFGSRPRANAYNILRISHFEQEREAPGRGRGALVIGRV